MTKVIIYTKLNQLLKLKEENGLESTGGNFCKTKFGTIHKGDILVILKKDGSRSVVRVTKFRESASSPTDKPIVMIEYAEIYPEISFEPLITLEDFENMAHSLKPVMYMSDREWDIFYEFLRHSRSLAVIREAYSRLETPDRVIIKRRPLGLRQDLVLETFDKAMREEGFKPVKVGAAKIGCAKRSRK